MSKRTPPLASKNLFGDMTEVEDANARPDMRRVKSLSAEVAAEAKITKRIQENPFAHLPSGLRTTELNDGTRVKHFSEAPPPRRKKKGARGE